MCVTRAIGERFDRDWIIVTCYEKQKQYPLMRALHSSDPALYVLLEILSFKIINQKRNWLNVWHHKEQIDIA